MSRARLSLTGGQRTFTCGRLAARLRGECAGPVGGWLANTRERAERCTSAVVELRRQAW